MKFILSLLLLFTLSCAGLKTQRVQTPDGPIEIEVTSPEEIEVIENIEPVTVEPVKDTEVIRVKKFTNFRQSEIDHFWKATAKVNEVINGKCFEDFMTNRNMVQTNGLSNKEVIAKLRGEKPVIEFVMYYSVKRVVGYTYPNVNKVWMNRRLHRNFSVCKSASNLGHEVNGHKLNFGHDFKSTQRRPYSVPYSINAAFTACCK